MLLVSPYEYNSSSFQNSCAERLNSQALHKARKLAIRQRTALCNQIRGLTAEYGISINQGVSTLRKHLAIWQSEQCTELSPLFKHLLFQLTEQLNMLDVSIDVFDNMIKASVKENAVCQRLQSIPGVGPMVASAYFNEVGNGSAYRKGRDVSASLGLVPKQYGSGGKDKLLGISKRGNSDLRYLLVQGAKAVVSRAKNKDDKLSLWINNLVNTRGHNRACVAYANKIARMAWAITVNETEYKAA